MEYVAGLGAAVIVVTLIKSFGGDDRSIGGNDAPSSAEGGAAPGPGPGSASTVIYLDKPAEYAQAALNPNGSLVAITAQWCSHCKNMKKEFEKVPELYASMNGDPRARFFWVETHPNFKDDELDVEGFPTVRFYMGGKGKDYNGPRSADGLTKFMISQMKTNSR